MYTLLSATSLILKGYLNSRQPVRHRRRSNAFRRTSNRGPIDRRSQWQIEQYLQAHVFWSWKSRGNIDTLQLYWKTLQQLCSSGWPPHPVSNNPISRGPSCQMAQRPRPCHPLLRSLLQVARPSFAASYRAASLKASPVTKSDMVKPIPASQLAPWSPRHETPPGSSAMRQRTASHEARVMPSGLPTAGPRMTPRVIRVVSPAPPRDNGGPER